MRFYNHLFKISVAVCLLLFVYSCIKKTTYSTVPEIEYKNFVPNTDESAEISIKFKDGDGDIGTAGNDTTRNLWVNYYYKDTVSLKYVAFCFGCGTDSLKTAYVVKQTEGSYQGKPISGELSVKLQQYRHSKKIKNIKYVIYLYDKAGNKSNVITTPELIVP